MKARLFARRREHFQRRDGIALHEDFAVTQEVDQLTIPEVTTEMMTR